MIDPNLYWVWLQHAFGEGSPAPYRIYREFPGGPEGFYQAGPVCWNTLDYVSEQHAVALAGFPLAAAQSRLEYAAGMGWEVLTPECEKYPDALRNISDPPAVLYIKGRLPDLNRLPAIGVAGAREAMPASEDAAKQLGYQLAAGGAVVVSGGALGVDSCAISGALSAMGRVVSVWPVDLSSPYLAQNAGLRQRILDQGGALATEYFSQRNPGRGSFQVRNRLIPGMSQGVVLVQVSQKSGSMLYARHAADQGRSLYVYPGPEGAAEYAGSRLLLDQGALPVWDGGAVLEDRGRWTGYRPAPAKTRAKGPRRVPSPPQPVLEAVPMPQPARALADRGADLPPEQKRLLECLAAGERSIGQLEEALGLPAGKLMAQMTLLELDGLVESLPGKRFKLSG